MCSFLYSPPFKFLKIGLKCELKCQFLFLQLYVVQKEYFQHIGLTKACVVSSDYVFLV